MLKFDKEQVHWQALDFRAPKPVSTSSLATQENLRGDEPEVETLDMKEHQVYSECLFTSIKGSVHRKNLCQSNSPNSSDDRWKNS